MVVDEDLKSLWASWLRKVPGHTVSFWF